MSTEKIDEASKATRKTGGKVILMPGVLSSGFKEQEYGTEVSVQSLRAIQEAAEQPDENDPIVHSESLL